MNIESEQGLCEFFIDIFSLKYESSQSAIFTTITYSQMKACALKLIS